MAVNRKIRVRDGWDDAGKEALLVCVIGREQVPIISEEFAVIIDSPITQQWPLKIVRASGYEFLDGKPICKHPRDR